VKRAQCIDKAKTSLLDFCIGDALIKLRSNLRMSSIKNKGSSENCLCSFFILCWDFPIERMTEQSEVNPDLGFSLLKDDRAKRGQSSANSNSNILPSSSL
jgi:hypothetical protein